MQQEDDLSCIDKALRMAMDAINNLSSCIDDKYMELTRGEDWHDRYVIKPIEALKEALQPDRTGLTYYKNDACKAQNANSPDCICWTPKQPIDQAATS